MDNQLVIDDPRVSRLHALLRAVHGQHILCDLNSSGGTFINGQRITQQALRPGDVISLAGFTLIYGEDVGVDGHIIDGDTTAFIPPSSRKK
jgi:pSer/pThr/pTyr-binding forkhead associated (FHA) protein